MYQCSGDVCAVIIEGISGLRYKGSWNDFLKIGADLQYNTVQFSF